jgi:hypothetical protein
VDACPALLSQAVKAVIMTNESGPPDKGAEGRLALTPGQAENESYAQAQRAHKRRKDLDQLRDKLERGIEIRAELEKAHSAQADEAQAAPSPETLGPIAAVLDLLSGQNAADLADLSEAAATRYAELKRALASARETAVRDLETGKGSTLATARAFRSAPPHVLDMLPGTPLVRKVQALVQMLNVPDEWNGFLDRYWTIGQAVLWVVTGDRWVVDQASNDSGKYGETWGQVRAADLIDNLDLQHEDIQSAADKLRRRCLDELMTAVDGQNRPIPTIEWRHLKIVLDGENVPHVVRRGQSPSAPAYHDVVFSRVEVLREFPPEGRSEDQDVVAPPTEADATLTPRRQPPSAAPPVFVTIDQDLAQGRIANWTAPTQLEIVGWSPTTLSTAPVQFDAQAERRSEALRSLHPTEPDAPAQPPTTASEPPQNDDGAIKKTVTRKKIVGDDTYANHQRDTKKKTGRWATRAEDDELAKKNGFSRDSMRAVRTKFAKTLSRADRIEFQRSGPRN